MVEETNVISDIENWNPGK